MLSDKVITRYHGFCFWMFEKSCEFIKIQLFSFFCVWWWRVMSVNFMFLQLQIKASTCCLGIWITTPTLQWQGCNKYFVPKWNSVFKKNKNVILTKKHGKADTYLFVITTIVLCLQHRKLGGSLSLHFFCSKLSANHTEKKQKCKTWFDS